MMPLPTPVPWSTSMPDSWPPTPAGSNSGSARCSDSYRRTQIHVRIRMYVGGSICVCASPSVWICMCVCVRMLPRRRIRGGSGRPFPNTTRAPGTQEQTRGGIPTGRARARAP
eukprot:5264505-Pyramimonas_sp.AAC.1